MLENHNLKQEYCQRTSGGIYKVAHDFLLGMVNLIW